MKTPQMKERLPRGVVLKLRENPGGGTHKSKRAYDRKRDKVQLRKQVKKLK